jgi:pre-mRNA-splicing factor CDC5/CEF1
MTTTQTPLLGQENTPMHGIEDGTGFESATPRHGIAATPNPLATPARGVLSTSRTVAGVGATPMRTPVRDNLAINDAASAYGETPMDEKRRAAAARRALKAGFATLPKPENNFELAEDEEEEGGEEAELVMTEEDAAERDARLKAAREEEERRELERRSSVVKKGLPRPVNVDTQAILKQLNAATFDEDAMIAAAMREVNLEMANLMKHDSLAHPLPGTSVPGGSNYSEYDTPEDEFVAEAKKAIHAELAGVMGLPGASEEQLRRTIGATAMDDEDAFAISWAKEREGLVYSPSARAWVEPSLLPPQELSAAYVSVICSSRERIVAEATKATKAEKKLSKQLGGYVVLNEKSKKSIAEVMEEIHQAKRDLETFLMLRSMEEAAAPARLERKREEVSRLERREGDLQARYAELNDERREREAAIEQVSIPALRGIKWHSVC